jgi:hypothetical protein
MACAWSGPSCAMRSSSAKRGSALDKGACWRAERRPPRPVTDADTTGFALFGAPSPHREGGPRGRLERSRARSLTELARSSRRDDESCRVAPQGNGFDDAGQAESACLIKGRVLPEEAELAWDARRLHRRPPAPSDYDKFPRYTAFRPLPACRLPERSLQGSIARSRS